MKTTMSKLLAAGAVLVFLGCILVPGSASAQKPAPSLSGIMDLSWVYVGTTTDAAWEGTVTIEGYDAYDMKFFHISPFKNYSQASPFVERFEIYNSQGEVVLGGSDVGVTVLANRPPDPSTYRMHGSVDTAAGPFEKWKGRHVQMSGLITWNMTDAGAVPVTAPGTLRIN